MQRATLSIPVGDHDVGDTFHVLGNVDAVGRATDNVDQRVSGDAEQPYYPLGTPFGQWGRTPWGTGTRGGKPAGTPPDVIVRTEPLYFGEYGFLVESSDSLGNVSPLPSPPVPFAVIVNSGPDMLRTFRQTASVGGQPAFLFTRPAQWL